MREPLLPLQPAACILVTLVLATVDALVIVQSPRTFDFADFHLVIVPAASVGLRYALLLATGKSTGRSILQEHCIRTHMPGGVADGGGEGTR